MTLKVIHKILIVFFLLVAVVAGVVIYSKVSQRSQDKKAAELKQRKINALEAEASLFVETGQWNQALKKYEEASKGEPDNFLLWGPEINSKIYLVKTKEDIKKIEGSLNNKTTENTAAYLTKILILSKTALVKGEFQQALDYLIESRDFLRKNPIPELSGITKNYFLSNIMATESYVYLFLGDIKNAEDLNGQSLALAPKNSLAYYFKSLIIIDKDYNDVASALEPAKLAVENLDEYFLLMKNYYSVFDRVVTKAKILVQLGNLYSQSGELEQAERYINEGTNLIDIKVYSWFYIFQVRFNLVKKDLKKAEEYLHKWHQAETAPKPNYYLVKASLDIANKDFSGAKVSLNKALELLESLGPPQWVVTPNYQAAFKAKANKLLIEIKDKTVNLKNPRREN